MTRLETLFLWMGGALFVLALADTAYTYLVVWANSAPVGRPGAVALDTILVSIFAFHHSLAARDAVKTWLTTALPTRLLRSVYVWMASALLIVVLALWRPVGGSVYQVSGWRAVLHGLVQLAGVGLIARAVAKIDALELAGIRSPAPSAGQDNGLQISGPYRLVRHPLYLGWILTLFGAASMTGDRLTFAVATTAYLVIAIPWEERSLEQTFGDSYRQYKRRVRWRVVPFLY